MEQWSQSTIEEWTHQSFTNLGSWYNATWMVTASSMWKPIQKELKGSNWPSDFPDGASSKESACQCRRHKRHVFDSWVRKVPWRRKWHPLQKIFHWKIPWTEDPDGLQTMWLQEKSWTELMTEHTCIPDRQYPHCYISLLSFLELSWFLWRCKHILHDYKWEGFIKSWVWG